MPICQQAMEQAVKLLGKSEAYELFKLATTQERLEARWRRKLKEFYLNLNEKVAADLVHRGEIVSVGYAFEEFFMEHYMEVVRQSIKGVKNPKPIDVKKLARFPYTLRGLQDVWDRWRKEKRLPKDLEPYVKKVKKLYIQKCQDVWAKHSKDFIKGDRNDMERAVNGINDASKGPFARSQMIVNTETTRYYNQTRKEYYDRADDVTHYLFMAIRDHRTTKWCKTRHGLVYDKEDRITKIETPPIHYSCRSEMVPLTRTNPRHEKLIKDRSRARRTHKPEPLLKGWND